MTSKVNISADERIYFKTRPIEIFLEDNAEN